MSHIVDSKESNEHDSIKVRILVHVLHPTCFESIMMIAGEF